jgi:hypothetical protein
MIFLKKKQNIFAQTYNYLFYISGKKMCKFDLHFHQQDIPKRNDITRHKVRMWTVTLK